MTYKILYIDITGRRIGGGQRSLLDLVKGLDRDKFMPQVILSEKGIFFEELKKNGIATNVFNMPTLKTINLVNRLIKIRQMKKLIKDQNINLIHTNSLRAALYGGFAAKWTKVPLVYHVRVIESGGLAERLVYGLSDKIIANSKAVKNKFSSFENFEKKNSCYL
jgi:UDP-N-acetylglucosamine:LPS N-acetylglucosamine transferase